MSCRKSVVWLILLLVPALLGPQNSALAQIFSGTSRLRMMGRAADGANYFAIMGHIKYPQTYLLPTSGPSLVDFIRFSGGALSTTNGQILIVRGERIVQQTMLTANSTIKLMPGDLVIIDGGRSGRGTIFRATENGAQRGASDGSTRPLQIALIGVKPYPIIMQMTPDVATKRWIVRQLGQDASVAGSVKALQRRRMSGPSGLDSRLSDNSVLIFPEGTIDTSRLPALPRPFRAGVDRQLDQQTQAKRTPSQPPGGAAAQIPVPVPQIVTSDTEPPTGASTPPGQSKVSPTPEPDSAASVESTRVLLRSMSSRRLFRDVLLFQTPELHRPDRWYGIKRYLSTRLPRSRLTQKCRSEKVPAPVQPHRKQSGHSSPSRNRH